MASPAIPTTKLPPLNTIRSWLGRPPDTNPVTPTPIWLGAVAMSQPSTFIKVTSDRLSAFTALPLLAALKASLAPGAGPMAQSPRSWPLLGLLFQVPRLVLPSSIEK